MDESRWIRGLAALALTLCGALAGSVHTAGAEDKDGKPAQEKNDPYPEGFRRRVDAAVDQGVGRLRVAQLADGTWTVPAALDRHRLGYTALVTLALLVGGVPVEDEAIERALGAMRPMPITGTYDAGTLLLLLHARYGTPQNPWSDPPVDDKGAAQVDEGCAESIPKEDRAWMQRAVTFLLENQTDGHWRYPEGGMDLSNTQYALLGLWAAARCGFEIPEAVWMSSLTWLLGVQAPTGRPVKLHVNEVRGEYRVVWTQDARERGFRYMENHPYSGSMTTAGIACLAICQEHLWGSRRFPPKLRKRVRKSIEDALAWMQEHFDVKSNPGAAGDATQHLTYYLYGMERAGLLARARFMGRYDWYLEGATYLLESQRGNGSWDFYDYLRDTAFAILFLKRSAGRLKNPVITPR
ncbi:MAG: hypothetical protein AB7T63_13665 [Planctomycetota bacterium]